MREFVRAKDPATGHEFTTSKARATKAGLTVLDKKDATDAFGTPLRAKHNIRKAAPKPPAESPKEG